MEPGTYGPVSVSLAEGGLALWASPSSSARQLWGALLDDQGRSKAPPFAVGTCEASLGLLTLKAVDRERAVVLVYSTLTDDQSVVLRAMILDGAGQRKGNTLELMRSSTPLLWVDVVDTPSGPIVFYAMGRDNRAQLRAVGLSPSGAVRVADREVVNELRAWQVVRSEDGAALAVVQGGSRGHGGQVQLLLLDAQAALVGKPIALTTEDTAELDLDLVRVGSNYVLAWSERAHVDSRVRLAAVEPSGKIVAQPTFATKPVGEQSLIKLVAPGALGQAALVWEDHNLPLPARRLSFAEIDEHAQIVSNVAYLPSSSQANTIPEIVATPEGWSVLTVDDSTPADSADTSESRSLYLELGKGLSPRGAYEVKIDSTASGTPLLAWGLDCRRGCHATLAFDGNPVRIRTARLSPAMDRDPDAKTAKSLIAPLAQKLPALVELETLTEVEPLSDMSVNREAGKFSVSYLTYFHPSTPLDRLPKPGPDGRTDPLQARLDLFTFEEGTLPTEVATVSFRATSQPGVSLTGGAKESGERALAWSALDQGQPQVFLSVLGPDGKKRAQRMLTHRKGTLDEVSLAPVAEGWFVGWIDERSSTPDVYVARVSKTLERRGMELRVSQGQGQVTALAMLPQSDHLLTVWAEARVTQEKRRVELFSRRLSLIDGTPLEPAQRILEIPGAVKFLNLAALESGSVLSWLEIMSEGSSVDAPGRVRLLRLDAKGLAQGQSVGLRDVPGSAPVSVAIDCEGKSCRGVVTLDSFGRGELAAFSFDPFSLTPPESVSLSRSLGTVEQNVAPVLIGEHLFAVDQVDAERARVVHAKIRWQ
ncbi:MAG: hypothetical protein QM784_28660 [Polyangiaceae bacterium]